MALQFFVNCVLDLINDIYSDSIWAKSGSVETFWRHNVTVFSRRFSAPERDDFASLMSLFNSFPLWQFCSPLFGFFRPKGDPSGQAGALLDSGLEWSAEKR